MKWPPIGLLASLPQHRSECRSFHYLQPWAQTTAHSSSSGVWHVLHKLYVIDTCSDAIPARKYGSKQELFCQAEHEGQKPRTSKVFRDSASLGLQTQREPMHSMSTTKHICVFAVCTSSTCVPCKYPMASGLSPSLWPWDSKPKPTLSSSVQSKPKSTSACALIGQSLSIHVRTWRFLLLGPQPAA